MEGDGYVPGDDDPVRSRPVLVFTGGDPVGEATAPLLPADAYVIAADSGLDEVYRLGLAPHRVVGDLDSVSPASLARARAEGALVDVYDTDKDYTDLELALEAARRESPSRIVVVGGSGGRLSHLLGNAMLVARPDNAGVDITWHFDATTVHVARPGATVTVTGELGDLVSLVPVGGDAGGVTTGGLRWRLTGATLGSGSTRGISNEMTEPVATVTAGAGTVLVIHERNP